jgi:hypothetical protein
MKRKPYPRRKRTATKSVLRLPDLEHAKAAVLNMGHVSVQTNERYLGCKQRIRSAVNDRIGIEPNP